MRTARVLAMLLSFSVVLGVAVLGMPGAGSAPPTPAANPAVSDFGSCVTGHKDGDVLLLIDTSGSLKQTDPTNARVTAAQYLLGRLQSFAATSGTNLSVAMAGFSDTYEPTVGWTPLTAGTLPQLNGALDGFRTRNREFDTDYWSALDGARSALSARTSGLGGAQRCQAIVWFTDGRQEIDKRDTPDLQKTFGTTKPYSGKLKITNDGAATQAERDAASDLCRPQGLADQLRAAGVVTFAIGLQPTGTTQNFSLMQGIATGSAYDNQPCGAITQPPPGDFDLVSNLDDLLFAFDQLSTPGQPPVVSTTGICQRAVCPQDAHTFVLDGSIRRVHILATSDTANLVASLQGPNSPAITLPGIGTGGQTVSYSGASVSSNWLSARSLEIELTRAPGAAQWPGLWSLTFTDPTGTSPNGSVRSSIHISTDIHPVWPAATSTDLHAGSTVTGVRFALTDSTGATIDPSSLLGTATLSVSLIPPTGAVIPLANRLAKSQITQPVTLDLTHVAPGSDNLRLTLDITTAPAQTPSGLRPGTALAPNVVDISKTIDPPVSYPRVRPLIDFGTVTGTGDAKGTLSVTGPGCVWLGRAQPTVLSSPSGLGAVSVQAADATSSASCLHLTRGQSTQLRVVLIRAHQGNGSLIGTVPVSLVPADGGPPIAVQVRFIANLQNSLNETHFWLALIAAVLFGIGIPALIVYLAKWATAKIPSRPLYAERMDLELVDGQVQRDGGALQLRETDFVRNLVPGGTRRIDVDRFEIRTRISRLPGGDNYVLAGVPGQPGVADNAAAKRVGGKSGQSWGRLPLAVHNHWVISVNPVATSHVALLLLAGADATASERAALVDDARSKIPARVRELDLAPGDPDRPGSGDRWAAVPEQEDADPFAGLPSPSASILPPSGRRGAVPNGPAPNGPVPNGPVPSGPMWTGAGPTGPAPTGPMWTGAGPTGPAPTGPMWTGPARNGPESTGPASNGSLPTGPAPANRSESTDDPSSRWDSNEPPPFRGFPDGSE